MIPVTHGIISSSFVGGVAPSPAPELFVYSGDNDGNLKKFELDGTLVWGISPAINRVSGIAVDSAGNVYIGTNSTDAVRRYNTSGTQTLSFSTGVRASWVTVNPAGTAIYVCSDEGNWVRKYNSSGTQQWSYSIGANGNRVAVDTDENIYVTTSNNLLIKLDTDGNFIWSVNLGSAYGPSSAATTAVKVDNAGHVYVSANNNSYYKLDASDGSLVWRFDGHSGIVNELAVDSSGNVYSAANDGTHKKVNSSGSEVYSYSASGLGRAVAVTPDGQHFGTFGTPHTIFGLNGAGTATIWTNTSHTDFTNSMTIGPG